MDHKNEEPNATRGWWCVRTELHNLEHSLHLFRLSVSFTHENSATKTKRNPMAAVRTQVRLGTPVCERIQDKISSLAPTPDFFLTPLGKSQYLTIPPQNTWTFPTLNIAYTQSTLRALTRHISKYQLTLVQQEGTALRPKGRAASTQASSPCFSLRSWISAKPWADRPAPLLPPSFSSS